MSIFGAPRRRETVGGKRRDRRRSVFAFFDDDDLPRVLRTRFIARVEKPLNAWHQHLSAIKAPGKKENAQQKQHKQKFKSTH